MTVASAVFVASSLCLSTVRATQPNVVAYIQRLFPETAKPDDVIRIVRNGKPLSLKKGLVDLVPGDQLFVKQGMVNVLLLYTGEVISVSPGMAEAGKPDFEVRSPDVPGLGGKLLALFKSLVGPDRSGRVIPATRGVDSGHCFNKAGGTNQPNEFKIPALFAEKPALAAGNRALFVTWRGGVDPFTVELASPEQGRVVARATVKAACAALLPVANLTAGQYQLTVVDGNRAALTERNLSIGDKLPAMPRELAAAPLPSIARSLYYATWLATIERGRWAFEAQQQVAALDCGSSAVREWLRQWGSLPPSCVRTEP